MLTPKQEAFLVDVRTASAASQAASGIPGSITAAQCIIESGWGQSKLSLLAHNYFGIKALPGQDFVEMPTMEYVNGEKVMQLARFARYASMADSFVGHDHFLLALPRYAPAIAVKDDPAAFAAQLQKCGYSTNPNYAVDLMTMAKLHNL